MAELFKIAGARELDKVLQKLPRKMGEKALRSALMAASKPMIDDMKFRSPVRISDFGPKKLRTVRRKRKFVRLGRLSGFLIASIRRRSIRSKDKLAATVLVGVFGVFYAHFQEYGTKNQGAKPFVRPGFDNNVVKSLGIMGKKLGDQIEKEALKLAGSFAKSGLSSRKRSRRR